MILHVYDFLEAWFSLYFNRFRIELFSNYDARIRYV